MTATIIKAITNGDSNVILQVSASDLKQIVSEMYHDEKARTEEALRNQRELPTLSRTEAAKALGVSLTTLWHWANDGYLKPVKIGNKVMYKAIDIDNILQKKT